MKIYVDEMPNSCAECPICKSECGAVAAAIEANCEPCPLRSLTEYDKVAEKALELSVKSNYQDDCTQFPQMVKSSILFWKQRAAEELDKEQEK
jgi:hypothetical protein